MPNPRISTFMVHDIHYLHGLKWQQEALPSIEALKTELRKLGLKWLQEALPSLGEGSGVGLRGVGGRSPLSVNFFHLRFGIASENHYLCRRESVQVLSLFSCSFANLRVIYRKRGYNLRQITVQSASSYKMFCIILRADMTGFSRWSEWKDDSVSLCRSSRIKLLVNKLDYFLKVS